MPEPTSRPSPRVALFPGSFDPVHNGHLEVIERAAKHFDELIVAAIRNPQKSSAMFTLEERKEMLAEATAHIPNVRIDSFQVLVVDFARANGVTAIIRGLRAVSDFENELQMAQMNFALSGIDTVFIPTSSSHSFVASKLLREVAAFGGDVSSMVPAAAEKRLRERLHRP